jgi:hypothetical protein
MAHQVPQVKLVLLDRLVRLEKLVRLVKVGPQAHLVFLESLGVLASLAKKDLRVLKDPKAKLASLDHQVSPVSREKEGYLACLECLDWKDKLDREVQWDLRVTKDNKEMLARRDLQDPRVARVHLEDLADQGQREKLVNPGFPDLLAETVFLAGSVSLVLLVP